MLPVLLPANLRSPGPPVVVGTQAAKATAESAMELVKAGLHTVENAMEDFNATGLVAGNHEFKVLPRNSRGTGPESDVSLVTIA